MREQSEEEPLGFTDRKVWIRLNDDDMKLLFSNISSDFLGCVIFHERQFTERTRCFLTQDNKSKMANL